MTRNLAITLVCACSLAAASSSVRVDETGCKVLLREAVPIVLLAVDNLATEAASARIALEWLDEAGVVRSSKDTLATIYPGRNSIRVPMDLVADSPWYRLRYRVRAAGGESTGILALPQISDDLFELRIVSPFFSRAGGVYEATVKAIQEGDPAGLWNAGGRGENTGQARSGRSGARDRRDRGRRNRTSAIRGSARYVRR